MQATFLVLTTILALAAPVSAMDSPISIFDDHTWDWVAFIAIIVGGIGVMNVILMGSCKAISNLQFLKGPAKFDPWIPKEGQEIAPAPYDKPGRPKGQEARCDLYYSQGGAESQDVELTIAEPPKEQRECC